MFDKGLTTQLCVLAVATSMGCLITPPLLASAYPSIILPSPSMTKTKGTVMTMKDAVLLTLRNSPNVISAELDRVNDKYALILAKYAYMPHFTLGGQFTANTGTSATATVSPIGASVKNSPIGVTGGISYDPSDGSTSISVKKELWAGNSYAANMNAWWTAKEAAETAKLAYRDNIVTAIHTTTQAYRSLVAAKLTLQNDKVSLNNDLEQLTDAKLKLKLGRGTLLDVNQSKLDVANDRNTIITDEQNVRSDRVALNEALGLDPNITINICNDIPLPTIRIGTLQQAIQAALAASTSYHTAKITLQQDERALAIQKNANKPSLTFSSDATLGGGSKHGVQNTLAWSIPIDNVPGKIDVISDRIKILKDKQALTTTRNTVISTVTLDYDNLKQSMRAWQISTESLSLNEETVKQQTAQFQAGQLSLFDLSTAKQNLTKTRNDAQTSKDTLWNTLESFRTDTGTVLSSWNISLNANGLIKHRWQKHDYTNGSHDEK